MSKQVFSIIGVLLWSWNLLGQSNLTYMVDPEFSTGESLRAKGPVFEVYPLEDGGFFLGGGFNTISFNPDSPFDYGLAMITDSGNEHPDWGGGIIGFTSELFDHQGGYLFCTTETVSKLTYQGTSWWSETGSPWGEYFQWVENGVPLYDVRWAQDLFILDDQSVLIGGAIVTDTLQPGVFRHLMRLMADGSHDADFPIIEAMPQGLNTHISKIERASDGTWYVSGRFEGINGHITPHIAHLSADFEVDTDFVSPFVYESVCCGLHMEMKLLDSQDRMWFSADNVKLASEPDEIYHLVRLLPDGTVDASFQKGQLTATYPEEYDMYPTVITKVIEPDLADDVFFIGGFFSHYNGVAQPSISALDDEGIIQSNYFNNQGPSLNSWNPQFPDWIDAPSVRGLEFLPDGSLMVGGSFSDFMGAERYNIVRLIQGTVSTEDPSADFGQFKMYPNPANDFIQMEFQLLFEKEDTEMRVYDQLGRLVKTYTIGLNTSGVEVLDTRKYGQGVYIVEIVQEGKQVFSDKFIVQH